MSISLTAQPASVELRQCIPQTIELGIRNRSTRARFVDVYVTPQAPLEASFVIITTYVPADWTVTVDVRVSAPPGTRAARYAVQFATGRRERLRVPVTVTAEAAGGCLSRLAMTATASSAQLPAYAPQFAIDGDEGTIWHTRYSPAADPLPQFITLALDACYDVTELSYQPRIGNRNGLITTYEVQASADGQSFTTVASGSWAATAERKSAMFNAAGARFVRLVALAGQGGFASAAELVLFGRPCDNRAR